MSRWFFSLQFRLVVGFALVLAVALGGVSLYVGEAARRETERFQEEMEAVRAERVQRMISRYFTGPQEATGLQPILEQAGSLYGWRIVVSDLRGQVMADSHESFKSRTQQAEAGLPFIRSDIPPRALLQAESATPESVASALHRGRKSRRQAQRLFTIAAGGFQVASVEVAPSEAPGIRPEPPVSRLVSKVNRSLMWTGLAAVIGGILLVSLLSRQVLAPVRTLSAAARRLGRGDLSQRISESGRDEIGALGRTFNSMADDLQRAEAQRRTLMADVAHELRTPISNIQGYLEAMRDGVLEPDPKTIQATHNQVVHLARLIEDLRLLTLAEAGGLPLDLQPDSLRDVLIRSVDAFRPRAEAKGVMLSLEVPDQFPLVDMDRTRIAQVVANLLENAVLHTPEGGRVAVDAAVQGGERARITVSDNGEGIPAEDLPHIFERLHRVDRSRSRASGGVGLGLTIARQLVEAHGGTIDVESTPGAGSRFVVELPMTRTARISRDDA